MATTSSSPAPGAEARRRRLAIALSFFSLGFSAFTSAAAQQDTSGGPDSSTIVGQLVARETHQPIPGGVVTVDGSRLVATSDSSGRFAFTGLGPGAVVLEIRAVGYAARSWRLSLQPRQVLTQVFELDLLSYKLPEVVVKGKQPLSARRFADFERHRQTGLGYFFTQEQIERTDAATLVDILVRARGVEQVCLANDCVAKMVRSPPGCYPVYFIDGRESSTYFARHTPPGDIRGIEIYRGASEIPGEFTGSGSACGVVAIWTKSSP